MISFLRNIIPERSPFRLAYHKASAVLAAVRYGFPGHYLTVLAVTGTSGKSTTTELIWYLLQKNGKKCGALSTIQFHVGDDVFDNKTLRTSLRPWVTQKWLKKMVKEGCEFVVIEASSHAIDQHRLWGCGIDSPILTNVYDNEHLDYHESFEHYKNTKKKLFDNLNLEYRKPHINKTIIVNADSVYSEDFLDTSCDRKITYSYKNSSDFRANNIELSDKNIAFDLKIPNEAVRIEVPIIGMHNLENTICAISATNAQGVKLKEIKESLKDFPGVPARLEKISAGQKFSILLDYTYKPSALQSVLETLKTLTKGRLIVVWGGAGGRAKENWMESGKVLHKYADEIVLTTDDPYEVDPEYIVKIVKNEIPREEGDGFFDIADRYEAIRYAILTANDDDLVLLAGRGHEKIQTIGKQKIKFEDKEVCKEILGKI